MASSARAGFSLIELVVATAIMGMAVVGLLSLVTQSLSNASHVADYDHAAMLARTKMNELLTADPLPLGERLGGPIESDWRWEALTRPFESGEGQRSQSILVHVLLRVIWMRDGRERQVEIESLRRMRRPTGSPAARPRGTLFP